MMRRPLCAVVAGLLSLPAAVQAHDLCIRNVTVHAVTSPATLGTVCVTGERISAVEAGDRVPDGASRIVDGTGMELTPGLVEAQTAIGLVAIWAVPDSNDTDGGGDDIRAAFRAVDGFDPASALLPVARSGGITSVVSSPSGGLVAGQAAWVDLADPVDLDAAQTVWMIGSLGPAGGDAAGGSRGTALLRYREIFTDARLYASDRGAYDRNQRRPLGASWLDLQALGPVLRGDLPLVLHADAIQDLRAGLALAEEFGVRVAFTGGADAWQIADELAAADATVIVDPLRNLPESFDALGCREDGAALLDAAGVRVVLTSGETHNARILRQNAGNAVRAGLPWDRALAAITLHPAELAGVGAEYGAIEVGRIANLALWSGDPFEPTSALRLLLVRGAEASTRSHQTELYERYRAR
jgi:imidazolonepropionase-like amidohydrolase